MAIKPPAFEARGFLHGLTLPLSGAKFLLVNRGLKRYAVLPLIFNVILYAVAIAATAYLLWNWTVYEVTWDFWGPIGRWLAAAYNWMGWLVKLVVFMLALGVAFFTFTAVGMALASPLNDILSEKVEMVYRGGVNKVDLPLHFTVKAGLVSFGDSMRNLVRQLFWTVVALPFLLVPVIGFLPLFLIGAYFAGFGFIDAAMARNFLRPPHKKLLVGRHFWEVVGFGAAMQALFAIPGFGLFLMPVGVTAGTLLYCKEDWEALLAENGMPVPEGFAPPSRIETATAVSAPPVPRP